MDDDANARVLLPNVLDLTGREARVDRAVTLPQNHARAPHGVRLETAPDLVRIPDDHVVERHAERVRGVATQMLIGKKENSLTAFPGPFQGGRGVGRGADDATAFAAEGFDGSGGVDVRDGDHGGART